MKPQCGGPSMAGAFVCVLAFGSSPAIAQGPPAPSVTVTNTAANPVPTKPQGTPPVPGAVNVANAPSNPAPVSGTVCVAGPITGAVSILNQPPVQIAGTPT